MDQFFVWRLPVCPYGPAPLDPRLVVVRNETLGAGILLAAYRQQINPSTLNDNKAVLLVLAP
jgi:hypothetical protein